MKPLNWIQWLTVMFVMVMAIIIPINFVQLNHVVHRDSVAAQEAHRALCLERKNFLDQYHATLAYLKAHPEGAPALGLSAASLRQTAAKQLAAALALKGLDCAVSMP